MSDVLRDLLSMDGVKARDLNFETFLRELKLHPQVADTAAALILRAIESRGEVEIEKAPPERRPYLRMLARMRVSSWKAFDHIKGSQRTVAALMEHLHNAAQNGHQLQLAVIFKGGPASGKGALASAIKDVLEGEIVYAVSGCPVHENPINLLTLLPPQRLDALAEAIGMTDAESKAAGHPSLRQLVATAGRPCQHCWQLAMGDLAVANAEPNLGDVPIEAVRLSSRNFGISTWSGQESLLSVLRLGSRGVVDMPELFALGTGALGSPNPELDLLLGATNDRRIPGVAGSELSVPGMSLKLTDPNAIDNGWLPLDAFLLGQTNDGALEAFLDAQPDKDKFTRRMAIILVPYNTSVTEEEWAYLESIANMRAKPHFDPMALKIAALTAVVSRMATEHEFDVVTRARLYDGEPLQLVKKTRSVASPNSVGTAGATSGEDYTDVADFWREAGADEGMVGLNMADMFKIISEVTEAALSTKHKSVSAIGMINFLRAKILELERQPGLTKKQDAVLKAVKGYLKGPRSYSDKEVGLIEREYRRVLVRQLFEVAAPDFDRRATELFERYRRHAKAYSVGDKDVLEIVMQANVPTPRRVKVDVEFLNHMDKWMGMTDDDERDNFRRAIEARIGVATQSNFDEAEELGGEPENLEITWRTIQEIADGIRKKLNVEIARVLEIVVKSEIELDEEQKKVRRETLERFAQLGYNEYTMHQALTYFRDYQLWKSQ